MWGMHRRAFGSCSARIALIGGHTVSGGMMTSAVLWVTWIMGDCAGRSQRAGLLGGADNEVSLWLEWHFLKS
jgi:hypothetical protein